MDLSFQGLRELREQVGQKFNDHPTASFVVSRVCDVFLLEYEDQGIPIERDQQIQGMAGLLEAVLEAPSDLKRIDELLRYTSRI